MQELTQDVGADAMVSQLLNELGSEPTMAKTLAVAAKLDRLPDASDAVRWGILRNVTLEPGLPAAIKIKSAQRGMRSNVKLGDFDAVQQEIFDETSFLYAEPLDVIVLALQLDSLASRLTQRFTALDAAEIADLEGAVLDRVIGFVRAIRERSAAVILVHNFEQRITPAFGILDENLEGGQRASIRRLNSELAKRIATVKACYIVDVDQLLSLAGYETSLDDRYWHIGRAPYRFAFCERLAHEYVKYAAALRGKTKKCLVLDCDNTLWGGVVGEDGINGIKLGETHPGSAYVAFQTAILGLYDRGVLLAINSKNNYDDAMHVFASHPNSVLKPEHFVVAKINWSDKVTNLREIAGELNIGLDSLVFVDDNAFECEYVRRALPEVTVIELAADPTRFTRALLSPGYFDTLTISDEDRRRSTMYRSELKRSELKTSTGSIDQYLQSLDMVLTISTPSAFSIPRIAQLTQKTNQFNLTTKRYSESDIERMMLDPAWTLYYAELVDRFDKAGIIAVALVRDTDAETHIDSLLMSCRVIGRGVEAALLSHIAEASAERGRLRLVGEFVPTAKNAQVESFYRSCGFVERQGSAGRWWDLRLDGPLPAKPQWFREVRVLEMVAK